MFTNIKHKCYTDDRGDDMDIPSRYDWFNNCKPYLEDKENIIQDYMKLFFTRTNTIFEYEGLPKTIPKEEFQLIKQRFGSVTIAKDDNGKLYAFYGSLGGVLDEYYHPTISIVTNPYLKLSKTYKIGEDCVVIRNDLFYTGLYNIDRKYAELLTECDISIRKCLLNIRIDNVLVSNDDSQDASIEAFFNAVKKGDFGYISSKKFMDDALIQIHNTASKTTNPLKDLIEIRNYIESCWWMEFGLNANANMKREAINDAEINADDKTMIPLIDQMFEEEQNGWKKVNEMFGLSVKVSLSPVWKKMKDEVVQEPNKDDKEGDNNETEENE